jgi:oligopeptide/dipeptide ABC transporter ATP-binding protein
MSGGEKLIEVKNVSKYFPTKRGLFAREVKWVRAVDNVSFYIRRGEVFGLVGESGCGKTTLGKLVLGLIKPTSGQILFDGIDITKLEGEKWRRLRRRMGIVYQQPRASLNPRMTVRTLLSRPIEIHRLAEGKRKEELILRVLREVGLGPQHLERYPHEFSGGQQQRIAIARVLVMNPEFIVLDEPTSALDVSVQAHILNLLADLQRKFGFTYLLISHDLAVVKHMSDRVGVMYLGKLVELAPKRELYSNPLHPYTRFLLAAVPVPDPTRRMDRRMILTGDVPSPIAPPPGCRFHTRCPYRRDVCSKKEPELRNVGRGHLVACHFIKSVRHRWPSP